MADDQTSSSARTQVGYCRPPMEARFRKGQSGNPAGRPSRKHQLSPRLRALLRAEALRPIAVHILGVETTLSVTEAAIRSLAVSAARGHPRELALFLDLLSAAENEDEPEAAGDEG